MFSCRILVVVLFLVAKSNVSVGVVMVLKSPKFSSFRIKDFKLKVQAWVERKSLLYNLYFIEGTTRLIVKNNLLPSYCVNSLMLYRIPLTTNSTHFLLLKML